MDTDRAVEHRLGGAGFHGHGKTLDDLARLGADHVQAHHAVGGGIHHQLHQCALTAARECVPQRLELAAEDGDGAKAFARLCLGQTHGTDVGMGEDGGGDELVAHAARHLARRRAEQLVDHHHRFAQCHRGQLDPVGHVAHRPDAGHVGAVVLVDDHLTLAALGHAHGFQTQTLHIGFAAGGVQHRIGHDHVAVFQFGAQTVVGLANIDHAGIQAQVHTGLEHLARDEVADLVIEAAQHLFAPVQLRDLRAHAIEDGGELAGDVATTDDEKALREGFQIEHLVGGDHMLAAHEVRHEGRAAGGDQDVGRREGLVARGAIGIECGHRHRVRAVDSGKAVDDGDARAAQQVGVDAVEATDFLGAVGLEGGPVQRRPLALPAIAVGLFKRLGVVRGVAVELLGDAADVDAGAAQAIGAQGFGHGHSATTPGGHAGRAHATAAATNDEQVKIEIAHDVLSAGTEVRRHGRSS